MLVVFFCVNCINYYVFSFYSEYSWAVAQALHSVWHQFGIFSFILFNVTLLHLIIVKKRNLINHCLKKIFLHIYHFLFHSLIHFQCLASTDTSFNVSPCSLSLSLSTTHSLSCMSLIVWLKGKCCEMMASEHI